MASEILVSLPALQLARQANGLQRIETLPELPFLPPAKRGDEVTATNTTTVQDCLRHLAGLDGDRAREQNGVGFSAFDGDFGHKLAQIPDRAMTPRQLRAAWVLARKYRVQLSNAGIDFTAIPEPPIVTDQVVQAHNEARMRQRGEAPAARREIVRPNPTAPFLYVRFPYDARLVADFRFAFGDVARWQQQEKVWRLPVPQTPDGCRRILEWANAQSFHIRQDLKEYLAYLGTADERKREASRATDADWAGPKLARQLHPFQRAGVRYIVEHAEGRGMIADEMGLGKSIQSIAAIVVLNAFPCLMITKATTKYQMRNEWLSTVPGMVAEDVYVIGSKWDNDAADRAHVLIINYDLVTKHLDRFMAIRFEGLIVDESHRCKTGTAQRTESIKAIATGRRAKRNEQGEVIKGANGRREYEQVRPSIPRRILLTGTPIINKPGEMIAQLEIMGRLRDLGGITNFKRQYCAHKTKSIRGREITVEVLGSTEKVARLNHELRGICYVQRDKAAVAPELPAIQRSIMPVELSPKFRREYERAELDTIRYVGERAEKNREFLASIAHLDETEREKAIAKYRNSAEERARRAEIMVMINHCKQIAGRGKVEAAREWIADFLETGQKLIVFAHHIEVQQAILSDYPQAVHILGSDSAISRREHVSVFQDDPAVQLIVCATEAASEGVTLTAASNVLFLELEWTPAAHLQAEARCYGRINDLHGANAHYLIAQDTIDESIMGLLGAKMAVCDALTSGEEKIRAAGESTLVDLVKMLERRAR